MGGKKQKLRASRVQQRKIKKRLAFPRNYNEEASKAGATVHGGTRVGHVVTSRTWKRGRETWEDAHLEAGRLLEKQGKKRCESGHLEMEQLDGTLAEAIRRQQ